MSNVVEAVLWHGNVGLPKRSLLFIDDVTAERSGKMNSEVYRAIVSTPSQPNAAKLMDSADG